MTENAPQPGSDEDRPDGSGRTPHPGEPAEGGEGRDNGGSGRTPHPEEPAEGAEPG